MPLGATVETEGVNFAISSRHAQKAWLAIFAQPSDTSPAFEAALNANDHRTGDVWSVFIEGLQAGAIYAWRIDGPHARKSVPGFDPKHYLLDPYARAVVDNNPEYRLKGRVIAPLDHGEARPPRIAASETSIYELHVHGFTAHPSAGVTHGGTYKGLIEKIPYLKDLGITAVELLPIHECGEHAIDFVHPETGEKPINYWGYNTVAFFAPAARYSDGGHDGALVQEFRGMVDAFHEAGLEVYLDVVYNHTGEGGADGRVICFRGIDNEAYYHLDDEGKDRDYSGCGNTFNCNHPIASELILDSLRYWATEMHIDGFRFDLATILNRDVHGEVVDMSPLIERISEDPVLKDVTLIAEAWDAAGGYQVGRFGNARWLDWNDRFRDDVRRFWRGDPATKADLALRLTGSPDLYQHNGRRPHNCINFVACHDGFTLRDLVSYNEKHNEANGEENRDGTDHNTSWNCGAEGEVDDPEINELRLRTQKSFLTTLFASLGVPMILGGDELGRTQQGNNNAYCQNNEISWLNWEYLKENSDLHRFCRGLIQLRKDTPAFRRDSFYDGHACDDEGNPDLAWYNPLGKEECWTDLETAIACAIHPSQNDGTPLYLMFNPTLVAREFYLPEGTWHVRINTARSAPDDIPEPGQQPQLAGGSAIIVGRKAMIIVSGHV
jgi:glycogen operon protein